jgi:hypothetical protein
VFRFRWHTSADRELTLNLHDELSGTWTLQGRMTRYSVESHQRCDVQIVLSYQIGAGQDALRVPVTLLQFDRRLIVGTIGDRFALKRKLAEDEQDPTTLSS